MKRLYYGHVTRYYLRKFKKVNTYPSKKMIENDDYELFPLGFSKTVYNDNLFQVIFNEDIYLDGELILILYDYNKRSHSYIIHNNYKIGSFSTTLLYSQINVVKFKIFNEVVAQVVVAARVQVIPLYKYMYKNDYTINKTYWIYQINYTLYKLIFNYNLGKNTLCDSDENPEKRKIKLIPFPEDNDISKDDYIIFYLNKEGGTTKQGFIGHVKAKSCCLKNTKYKISNRRN